VGVCGVSCSECVRSCGPLSLSSIAASHHMFCVFARQLPVYGEVFEPGGGVRPNALCPPSLYLPACLSVSLFLSVWPHHLWQCSRILCLVLVPFVFISLVWSLCAAVFSTAPGCARHLSHTSHQGVVRGKDGQWGRGQADNVFSLRGVCLLRPLVSNNGTTLFATPAGRGLHATLPVGVVDACSSARVHVMSMCACV